MRKESLEVNSFPMINKNRKKRGQWVRGADTLPFAGKEARGMEKKTYSYIVSAEEMKRYDSNTIHYFGIPSLVLMERAALAVAEEIEKRMPRGSRILVVAGGGNNGGDGIAIARILGRRGYQTEICFVADRQKASPETRQQLAIAEKYGCPIKTKMEDGEYDMIVDALFGIGLSRKLEGDYAALVQQINQSSALICAVDIPSGIDADTGNVMGVAVKADLTVTFAFRKPGHILYPGCIYASQVLCRDIGIGKESFLDYPPRVYTYEQQTDEGQSQIVIPARRPDGHKGSFGKVLVIAGSVNMSGACQLCAESCFRMGVGMVKVLTPEENRIILQTSLPEALLATYSAQDGVEEAKLASLMDWADCILIGPGLGRSKAAGRLLTGVLTGSGKPLVVDADGINLLAGSPELKQELEEQKGRGREIMITPHLVEFARLYGCRVEEVKEALLYKPKELADRYGCTLVCKDARTVVAAWNQQQVYLNSSGNDGLATAGSGDVLAGMLAGLLAQGMKGIEAAALGVYLHGKAGERAAARLGRQGMLARDLMKGLTLEWKALVGKGQEGAGKESEDGREVG